MDKVIIDGVDVSGCEHYREPMPYGEIKVTEHYCWHINSNCDGKNCDYKEIKRLQAENERLKEESEQLKKQYNCYACDSCGGKEDYINMKRHTENAIKTVHKYSQALQEIREMATLFHSVNENKGLDRFKNNILTKINSVIGGVDET